MFWKRKNRYVTSTNQMNTMGGPCQECYAPLKNPDMWGLYTDSSQGFWGERCKVRVSKLESRSPLPTEQSLEAQSEVQG